MVIHQHEWPDVKWCVRKAAGKSIPLYIMIPCKERRDHRKAESIITIIAIGIMITIITIIHIIITIITIMITTPASHPIPVKSWRIGRPRASLLKYLLATQAVFPCHGYLRASAFQAILPTLR